LIEQVDGRIRWIYATHTHRDHSPAARYLAERTGGELIGCVMDDDGHQDLSFNPARNICDGEVLTTSEFTLEAVATPGHVGNHFCFWLPEDKMMFTGDHLMQGTTVVIIPPSGCMLKYIASLEKLNDYPIQFLAPGHGHVMGEAKSVVTSLIRHRLMRETKVVSGLKTLGKTSMLELVKEVYKDVDVSLHPIALYSLWAHLLKLEQEQRAVQESQLDQSFEHSVWVLQ
jgi:glyoxylase-like metal-dependent hydrolase (beta-lactamase superfamily II)